MEMDPGFKYYYRVESLAKPVPSSYRTTEGADRYVHIVAFNDPKDHEEMIRDYLRYYCRVDPDSDDSRWRGLVRDHFLCANAILTYYLRSAVNRRVEVDKPSEPVDESEIPNAEPVFQAKASAIWLVAREENVRIF